MTMIGVNDFVKKVKEALNIRGLEWNL